MASAGTMYSVKPHYDVQGGVELPGVMYKVKRLVPHPTGLREESSPQTLEDRQETLLKKLDAMISKVASKLGESSVGGGATSTSANSRLGEIIQPNTPVDIVIRANPSQPPLWLGPVKKQLEDTGVRTWWKFHTHSSVIAAPSFDSFPAKVPHENRHQFQMIVTVIWSNDGQCPSLHIYPSQRSPICGETNIFRFFGRLLSIYDTSSLNDAIIDMCLDACDVILSPSSTNQEKASVMKSISNSVEKGSWFGPDSPPLLTGFLASVLKNYGVKNIPQETLKKWVRENGSRLVF